MACKVMAIPNPGKARSRCNAVQLEGHWRAVGPSMASPSMPSASTLITARAHRGCSARLCLVAQRSSPVRSFLTTFRSAETASTVPADRVSRCGTRKLFVCQRMVARMESRHLGLLLGFPKAIYAMHSTEARTARKACSAGAITTKAITMYAITM